MECTGSTSFGKGGRERDMTRRGKRENRHFSFVFLAKNRKRKWYTKRFSYLNVLSVLQFLRLTPRACAPTSVSLLYFTLGEPNGQYVKLCMWFSGHRYSRLKGKNNCCFGEVCFCMLIKQKQHILNTFLQRELSSVSINDNIHPSIF